ncbi:ATP phosphoribosyltransferase [Candidatus Gottesmanbacteria bacterium RIFCSPHIGHO2_02_FULL_39_14]|uniref:ATP phosphoribosyltransferase n=1 Tax=Candidatus Gottesmanbacteria bacterium RIFCSPHIGHO2_02_FULL_39_14 TaxID=1798383 RepID=A0A1F6A2C8_9BACT|nr:MAG: ATP phosphoribosyltransferase [Candidatus Gottesmanbacteria bacterium RIFCSPHIGHO2_02_FULL_39_14]
MKKFNNGNLKLAIQKEGRLTQDSLAFLRQTGLEFESYQKLLYSSCRNFPLEILYLRDDDIPNYVSTGVVDLGIAGQNILSEKREPVKKLLNLRFGFCSLVIAVPKDSPIKILSDLNGKRIATSYPNSSKVFFKKNNIQADLVQVRGSVEITPAIGVADAIIDLTSTGSTLILQDLRVLTKIYDSEAVLVANNDLSKNKKKLVNNIITRFKGALSAKNYKYINLSAEEKILPRLKKIIPVLGFQYFSFIPQKGKVSVTSVIKEDIFWETIEKLKIMGIKRILVLPIEKMII